MSIKEGDVENKTIKIKSYQKTTELGRIIGKKGTVKILCMLDQRPCQHKELNCYELPSTTFNNRIKELQSLDIIKKIPITSNRRETHQYTLTLTGNELMKFIHRYEKMMKVPLEQQKIFERGKKQFL